jgi:hypothetical protein
LFSQILISPVWAGIDEIRGTFLALKDALLKFHEAQARVKEEQAKSKPINSVLQKRNTLLKKAESKYKQELDKLETLSVPEHLSWILSQKNYEEDSAIDSFLDRLKIYWIF